MSDVSRVYVDIGDVLALDPTATGAWDISAWDNALALWAGSMPNWTEIACRVTDVEIDRGRNGMLDLFDPGRCTVKVDNDDGWATWSPDSVAQPVAPGSWLRVRINDEPLFTGTILRVLDEYEPGQRPTAALVCVDALARLAQVELPPRPPSGAGETAAQRIGRVLDLAMWSQGRSLDAGGPLLTATDLAGSLLDQAQRAAVTAGGALFVDRDGTICYRDAGWLRTDERSVRTQAIVTNGPPPPPPSGFNPLTQVPATHVYWADDPAWAHPVDGGRVDSWRNATGGPALANTGTQRPTYTESDPDYNGHAVIRFNAAALTHLFADVADLAQPFKMLVIADGVSPSAANQRVVGIGDRNDRGIGLNSSGKVIANLGASISGPKLAAGKHAWQLSAGTTDEIRVDGALAVTGDAGALPLSILTAGGGRTAAGAIGQHLTGRVAFLGVYPAATPNADLSALGEDLLDYYSHQPVLCPASIEVNGPDVERVLNVATASGNEDVIVPEGETQPDPVTVTATDATSANRYGPASWSLDNLYTRDPALLTTLAERVLGLRAQPAPHVQALTLAPLAEDDGEAFGADVRIGDRLEVQYVHPEHGWGWSFEVHVHGISHRLAPAGSDNRMSQWDLNLRLDDASFWLPGSAWDYGEWNDAIWSTPALT